MSLKDDLRSLEAVRRRLAGEGAVGTLGLPLPPRVARGSVYLISVYGPDYPAPKVVASRHGAKAAEQAVHDIFHQRAPLHYLSGVTQVCVTRLRAGESLLVDRPPDRCYALAPRGQIVRV